MRGVLTWLGGGHVDADADDVGEDLFFLLRGGLKMMMLTRIIFLSHGGRCWRC